MFKKIRLALALIAATPLVMFGILVTDRICGY